jgi:hypothetical protein
MPRSPRGPGFLTPVACKMISQTWASASRGQDHATSPSAWPTFVRRALRVHRIPASDIVTIGRNIPLHRGGMRESMISICRRSERRWVRRIGTTGSLCMGCMPEVSARQVTVCAQEVKAQGARRVQSANGLRRGLNPTSNRPFAVDYGLPMRSRQLSMMACIDSAFGTGTFAGLAALGGLRV